MLLDRKHVLRDRRGERGVRGVDEHLEAQARIAARVGVDVDPMHPLREGPLDLQGRLRSRRHLAVDREHVVDVLRLALRVEREHAGLRLLDLEARHPVADVPVLQFHRVVLAAEVAVQRADRERFELSDDQRRPGGQPPLLEVFGELRGRSERRRLAHDLDPRELRPRAAVPRHERGLAVGPPLPDGAEVATVERGLHVDILELAARHVGVDGHLSDRHVVVEIDGEELRPLVVGERHPRRARRRADHVVGIVALGRIGGIGRRLPGAGRHPTLEDTRVRARLRELHREAVAAGGRRPHVERVGLRRRAAVGIDHAHVDGVARLDLVFAAGRGERRASRRALVELELRADQLLERPVLEFLLGEDRAAGGKHFRVGDDGHRRRLLHPALRRRGERLGERVADGVAAQQLQHAVALRGRAELRGDLTGEACLGVTEREEVEILLVAAGRPGADLDLRGLADDGEVAILEIHLERLARDEKLLVSEHAELHLRGHVVLAAHQIELAFEDPAADVVGNTGEHLLEEPGRLLDLLLVGLQQRELEEGLGLETTVGPPRELLEQFPGAVELPGEPVDLSHPQFSVGLAG